MALTILLVQACNNDQSNTTEQAQQTQADSLTKEIDDIHIKGMSKMGQLNNWQKKTRAFIDSINQLPAKSIAAAENLRQEAERLLKDLDYADYAMNEWMPEFYAHPDTLSEYPAKKLDYLKTEKEKAAKITEAIVSGIRRADSLLSNK